MQKVAFGKLSKPCHPNLGIQYWRFLGRLKPYTDGLALYGFADISAMCRSREKIALHLMGYSENGVVCQEKTNELSA